MPDKFTKIAVVGKMHSGKSTLASVLMNRGARRLAFARPVKDISVEMLNLMATYLGRDEWYTFEDIERIKGNPPIRKLLQLVGTELGRDFFGPEDIWVQQLLEKSRTFSEDRLVNDDCRFANEAAALMEDGWLIVKLHRPEDKRVQSILDAIKRENPQLNSTQVSEKLSEMLAHPSETEVDSLPFHIQIRSTSVHSLQGQVVHLLESQKWDSLYDSNLVEYSAFRAKDPEWKSVIDDTYEAWANLPYAVNPNIFEPESIEHDGLIRPMTEEDREEATKAVKLWLESRPAVSSLETVASHSVLRDPEKVAYAHG